MAIDVRFWSDGDYLNVEDMNRIESNMDSLATLVRSVTYVVPSFTTVTNRSTNSLDYLSSINRLEANLDLIRASFITPAAYLPMETWVVGKPITSTVLNRWEQNIQLLYNFAPLVYSSFRYCGNTRCGGGGLY